MARKDLESIKFKKGDLVCSTTWPSNTLGIVLEQRGMRIIVKWVAGQYADLLTSKQTIYSLEKVGEEGAK
tara:strand:+ start:292 stop:501 length:210 start_codon:yes stop_codon:yes gene_type:complete